jgi:hypothetical protein
MIRGLRAGDFRLSSAACEVPMKRMLMALAMLAGVSGWGATLEDCFGETFATNLTWSQIWSRDKGKAQVAPDKTVHHQAAASLRIEHQGADDWSLTPETRLPVQAGDLLEAMAWVRVAGKGSATVCFILRDAKGQVLDWSAGEAAAVGDDEWHQLRSRLLVPEGVASCVARLIGHGPATTWMEGYRVRRLQPKTAAVRQPCIIRNELLEVAFDPATSAFAVRDMRTGQRWIQQALGGGQPVTLSANVVGPVLTADLFDAANDLVVQMKASLEPRAAELVVELTAAGAMRTPLNFPPAFVPERGTRLIVPVNEGIAYPVDDPALGDMRYITYGGHGICMSFFGATDDKTGVMTLLETADDAQLQIKRNAKKLLAAQPVWVAERQQFGYARKLRYIFFNQGGYVAMCKRYRAFAAAMGRLKTFTQKRAENPNIDLLAGAVNVWFMDGGQMPMVRALQSNGIQRILWSAAGGGAQVAEMNKLPGVLTSRYDIFQDAMNPEKFPLLRYRHGDWTSDAWPTGMVLRANGDWERGWEVEAKDGTRIPCGVLCDKLAPAYARRRIPEDLKTHSYRCRFIDTTTASSWRECYSPAHPMTRRESRETKMELLAVISRELKLVCGSETGHDAAVPYADYFEGMLSLGPYRVPDSGRKMMEKFTEVPERVAKFQVGAEYRLPLWELVYHDCCVAQWYWGDYNNKLPALWDKRDLFNALYGTPPMFMFNRREWDRDHARFVQSYRTTCPIARATFYSEMTDHRILTADRLVQQSRFANGVTVTVNFGTQPFKLPNGRSLGALSADVSPLPKE